MIKLVIFDFNRTLYNVEDQRLASDCVGMLNKLTKKYSVVILSSMQPGREKLINKTLGEVAVHGIKVVEEKNKEIIVEIMNHFYAKPKETMIVGDYLKEEISLGNDLGCFTVWVKSGKFSGDEPTSVLEKPDFVLDDLGYENIKNVLESVKIGN